MKYLIYMGFLMARVSAFYLVIEMCSSGRRNEEIIFRCSKQRINTQPPNNSVWSELRANRMKFWNPISCKEVLKQFFGFF